MKILDIPQSGKRGLTVSMGGRYGQVSRALAIPSNPRTVAQLNVRGTGHCIPWSHIYKWKPS